MTVLFYFLLRPVSRSGSLLAAVFSLVGCTIKTLSRLFYFAPLLILQGDRPYLGVFAPEQLQSLAFRALTMVGANASERDRAFGWWCGRHGILEDPWQ